jgi:WD40 repeat protein
MMRYLLSLSAGLFFGLAPAAGGPPEPKLKLVLQAPPPIAVNSVAVSPDGSIIAAGAGGVRLYDARTGALLRALGGSWDEKGAGSRGVAFSRDGRALAGAGFSKEKVVGIVDVQTGKRVQSLAGHTEWETDTVAFSPDGKLLASTGVDKQILVWELATGKLRHRLADQPSRAPALAFSPDSATLASGSGDKQVRLWDTATGRLRRSLAGHGGWVCTIAFSPDGKTLASGSCDWGFHRGHNWPRPGGNDREACEWRLWDVASGELRRAVKDKGRLLSLAIAPDGKSLACSVGKELRLYDLSRDAPARVMTSHDATITSVAFTPDSAAVVTGSHDQTVKRTDVVTGKVQWQAPGYFEQVNSVALTPDASLLVTGSSDHRFAIGRLAAGAREIGPGAVRVWDLRKGRMLRRLGDPSDQVMAVAVSSDGRQAAAGVGIAGGKGGVRVWDVQSGAAVWSTNDLAAEALSVAFAPDGASLAVGSADGRVVVLDSKTGRVARTLAGHEGGATSVTFAPDGKTLICGEGHGGARVWDARTGTLARMCRVDGSRAEAYSEARRGHSDRLMNSIGLTRDGAVLATCGSSINDEFTDPARLWDPRTSSEEDSSSSRLKREFKAENIHGRPMALSPDGTILATGGKSVRLWDVRTGTKLRELLGHLKRTQSIAFSTDGRLVVAGGSYGTTNVWEVATGRHMVTLFAFLERHRGADRDDWLAYHPEGFYSGSPDIDRFLGWRDGDDFKTPATLGAKLRRTDRIEAALKLSTATTDRR